jgi:hypothetical protein
MMGEAVEHGCCRCSVTNNVGQVAEAQSGGGGELGLLAELARQVEKQPIGGVVGEIS